MSDILERLAHASVHYANEELHKLCWDAADAISKLRHEQAKIIDLIGWLQERGDVVLTSDVLAYLE